jgi:hypothetical protein
MRIAKIFKFRNKAIFVSLFECLGFELGDKLLTCKNRYKKFLTDSNKVN